MLRHILAIALLLVAVVACWAHTEKWKEEVQLSDGRVIVVERETIHEAGGDEWVLNRSGTKPKEHRIHFKLPELAGQTIVWKTTKKSPSTWPEIPLFLDVEAGHPMIMASVYLPDGCEVYLKYVFRNGAWIEETLPDKFAQRTTNLLIRDGVGMPEFVSLQEKKIGNESLRYRLALRRVGPTRRVCG